MKKLLEALAGLLTAARERDALDRRCHDLTIQIVSYSRQLCQSHARAAELIRRLEVVSADNARLRRHLAETK